MLIVFILLLTLISIALRFTSMSISAQSRILKRLSRLNKLGTASKATGVAMGVTAKGVKFAASIVSIFRNLLLAVLPLVLILDVFVLTLLVASSSGFTTLQSDLGSIESPNSSGGVVIPVSPTQPSHQNRGKVLLIGDSRTVGLAVYVLGAGSDGNGSTVIGSTSGNDYIIAKTSMGISWMRSMEDAIDSIVDSDTAIVINMGTNDAATPNISSSYVSWINDKSREWISKGATVWFMNTGPVDDSKSQYVKNEDISRFNSEVKRGLVSSVGYIDLYSALENTNILYDSYGIHYDRETYRVVWNLVVDTVK
jgi:hypothetical protein